MELRPCPFCGATEPTVHILDAPESLVACDYRKGGCGASGRPFNTDKQAIEAWNTRAERTCHTTWDIELTGRLRFKCSECGAVSLDVAPRYCPACGARVVEEVDADGQG